MALTGSGSVTNPTVVTGVFNGNNQEYDIDTTGMSTLIVSISGTYAGDVAFIWSNDEFVTTNGLIGRSLDFQSGVNINQASQVYPNANGNFVFDVSGINKVGVFSIGADTNTSTITMVAVKEPSLIKGIIDSLVVSDANALAQLIAIETAVSTINMNTPPVGQGPMATSVPVVIASNQTSIPVDASGHTLPISALSLPLPTNAATSALQTTANTTLLSIDTKTPALGQALMTLSSPVVIASNQTAIPVSGTFFQTTQPVSGPLTDTQLRATAVPVSGPLTDTQLRATAVPVSQNGTWTVQPGNTANTTAWKVDASSVAVPVTDNAGSLTVDNAGTFAVQAAQSGTWTVQPGNTANTTAWKVDGSAVTQPVSISGNQAVNNAQIAGVATATGNGVVGTGVQRVAIASDNTVIPMNNAQINGVTPLMGNGVTGTGSQRVTIASDNTAFSVNATGPTLTKGTQNSTGFSVQNLNDAGRNHTNFFMAIQIVSSNTDTLLSLTGYKGGAAVGATTTPAVVTSGKTYRITSISLTYVTIVTTPGAIRFTLRANTGGAVQITSPAVANWTVGEPTGVAPVAGKFNTVQFDFPEGLEFAAGTGIGLSMVGLNTVGTAAAVGYGIATIMGYEY